MVNESARKCTHRKRKAQYLLSVGNVVLPHHHQGAKYDGTKHSPILLPDKM